MKKVLFLVANFKFNLTSHFQIMATNEVGSQKLVTGNADGPGAAPSNDGKNARGKKRTSEVGGGNQWKKLKAEIKADGRLVVVQKESNCPLHVRVGDDITHVGRWSMGNTVKGHSQSLMNFMTGKSSSLQFSRENCTITYRRPTAPVESYFEKKLDISEVEIVSAPVPVPTAPICPYTHTKMYYSNNGDPLTTCIQLACGHRMSESARRSLVTNGMGCPISGCMTSQIPDLLHTYTFPTCPTESACIDLTVRSSSSSSSSSSFSLSSSSAIQPIDLSSASPLFGADEHSWLDFLVKE